MAWRSKRLWRARRAAGQRRVPSLRTIRPLVTFLREVGVMAPEARPRELTPLEQCVGVYRSWLVGERGLAAADGAALREVWRGGSWPGACRMPASSTSPG